MPHFVLLVPLGFDVVHSIISFAIAGAHLTGTVLAAYGKAKNFLFHNPAAEATYLMVPGSYGLVSLRGHFKRHPNGGDHYEYSFSATIADDNGHVLGGVLAGSIVALSLVKVIISVPENPQFVELALNDDNAPQEIAEAVMFPAQADENVDQGDAEDGAQANENGDQGAADNGSPPPAMENGYQGDAENGSPPPAMENGYHGDAENGSPPPAMENGGPPN